MVGLVRGGDGVDDDAVAILHPNSSPVDMLSYELCCDMIDVVIDVSCIYG